MQPAVDSHVQESVDPDKLERHREKRRQQAAARKERKKKEDAEAKRQRLDGEATPSGELHGQSPLPFIYLGGELGQLDHADSPAPTVASSVDASTFWPTGGHDTSEYNTEAEDGFEDAILAKGSGQVEMDVEDELAAAAGVYG